MRTERLGRIHGRRALRSHASGFTLIELLIVIAIVAILATIALSAASSFSIATTIGSKVDGSARKTVVKTKW